MDTRARYALAVAPEGDILASGSEDGSVRAVTRRADRLCAMSERFLMLLYA